MSVDGPVYEKYRVERTDGQDYPGGKHANCDLFVLDLTHDPYAIPAIQAYADACRGTHPQLSEDLERKIHR